ncbi:transporter [Paraburkholderia sp. RL17-383-BIF-A]|uniref:transporter n=1 Tax=Paraburkholderia sp. RL17-383-BIF-A TaxID=3031631 RepID=UPI0038BDA4F3
MRNTAAGLLFPVGVACAQELEPRTYSPSPVGTHFLVSSWSHLSGDVLTDSSLPISGVRAQFNLWSLAYVSTFGFLGHTASLGIALPFARGNVSGDVLDSATEVHRSGLGDMRLRFAFNLFGNPPLPPDAFAAHESATAVGTSLTIIAPTGQYVGSRLVNIGTNRWSFKPEFGVSQTLGKWFVDGSAGVWFFTSNNEFFNGAQRTQAPLMTFQLHGGYTFRPGFWLAGDLGYTSGGRTSTNDVEAEDRQANVRYGVTVSAPIARGWSTKLALSHGLVTRAGGDFTSVTLTLQYRWFDR